MIRPKQGHQIVVYGWAIKPIELKAYQTSNKTNNKARISNNLQKKWPFNPASSRSHTRGNPHLNPIRQQQGKPTAFRLNTILSFVLYQLPRRSRCKTKPPITSCCFRWTENISDILVTKKLCFYKDKTKREKRGSAHRVNQVPITEQTNVTKDPFDATKIASVAAISPTAVQIIPFLPLGK